MVEKASETNTGGYHCQADSNVQSQQLVVYGGYLRVLGQHAATVQWLANLPSCSRLKRTLNYLYEEVSFPRTIRLHHKQLTLAIQRLSIQVFSSDNCSGKHIHSDFCLTDKTELTVAHPVRKYQLWSNNTFLKLQGDLKCLLS